MLGLMFRSSPAASDDFCQLLPSLRVCWKASENPQNWWLEPYFQWLLLLVSGSVGWYPPGTNISHLGKAAKSSTQTCQTGKGYVSSQEGNQISFQWHPRHPSQSGTHETPGPAGNAAKYCIDEWHFATASAEEKNMRGTHAACSVQEGRPPWNQYIVDGWMEEIRLTT